METSILRVIQAALYVAGAVDRGLMEWEASEVREIMAKAELSEEHFHEVQTMIGAFFNFAQDVRASERKKRSIIRASGEILPSG